MVPHLIVVSMQCDDILNTSMHAATEDNNQDIYVTNWSMYEVSSLNITRKFCLEIPIQSRKSKYFQMEQFGQARRLEIKSICQKYSVSTSQHS
jgi:hypothetical protein